MPQNDVDLWLQVDGKPLRSYGAWGSLTFSTSWPGGCKEASWTMSAKYGARFPVLRRGVSVQVLLGTWPLFTGYLSEPDWNGTEVALTANGLSRLGEQYTAFDADLAATLNPTTAINAAPGLGWAIGAGIPNVDLDIPNPSNLYNISELLDAHAKLLGRRWGVDAFGVVTMAADPVSVQGADYLIRQGAGDLGIAEDNYASHVVLNYQREDAFYARVAFPAGLRSGPASSYEVRYGHSEKIFDISDQGPITDDTAQSFVQALYMRSLQRPGWTNGLTLAHGEVLTQGGNVIHPALLTANRLARKLGTPDEVALTSWTDFVVGETEYVDGSGVVNLNPVSLASRSQEDVFTELLEATFPEVD